MEPKKDAAHVRLEAAMTQQRVALKHVLNNKTIADETDTKALKLSQLRLQALTSSLTATSKQYAAQIKRSKTMSHDVQLLRVQMEYLAQQHADRLRELDCIEAQRYRDARRTSQGHACPADTIIMAIWPREDDTTGSTPLESEVLVNTASERKRRLLHAPQGDTFSLEQPSHHHRQTPKKPDPSDAKELFRTHHEGEQDTHNRKEVQHKWAEKPKHSEKVSTTHLALHDEVYLGLPHIPAQANTQKHDVPNCQRSTEGNHGNHTNTHHTHKSNKGVIYGDPSSAHNTLSTQRDNGETQPLVFAPLSPERPLPAYAPATRSMMALLELE
ncbi:hypothetical protein SARC_03856 [Sphaeroforma arctica JP610]|uniref:Uncharacterized protein n=1 Tax=Sphaeroforma arctica JP610 TaxID=667725 RepID=A0A0L0G519_9EUKA|nr:hypothetical protein SARC_03856 [Sphaeroforma arctica JP610]KNC83921.1 hypothetical protein SARC_03856 [Sphaeroforma arctica JP610]|eukprot:XP_014157823.1 hypothetical protein SARC_03856 [Sphaeroforma arctica JP610]